MNRLQTSFFLLMGFVAAAHGQDAPSAATPPKADPAAAAALYAACAVGDVNKVKSLLDAGTPIDSTSGQYAYTPLIGSNGQIAVQNYLIQQHADLDLPDTEGSTALLHACWDDQTDSALALINAGAHVNYASNAGRAPIMYAALHGNDPVVSALIDHKVKVDANCSDGPAVLWAASADKLSTLKLLAAAGAKLTLMPERNDTKGESIMTKAASNNDLDMINFLLNQKVDVNTLDADGSSGLMAAAEGGYTKVVELLLDKGAGIDLQNNDGDTALMLSRGVNTTSVLLLRHANAELKNKKGMTALMMAAARDNSDRVHALVDGGADINVADAQGETALTMAGDAGGTDIVDFLKGKGAQRTDVHVIIKGQPDPSLTPAQSWALAVGAFYIQVNEFNPKVLGGGADAPYDPKTMLKRDWSITDHASLMKELDDLRDSGHHAFYQAEGAKLSALTDDQFSQLLVAHAQQADQIKAMRASYVKWKDRSGLAWDICRAANLINCGFAAHYLTEQEAWDRLMANAQLAQKSFTSWQELGDNFLDGREIWAKTRSPRFDAFAKLFLNPNDANSPWNQNPWKTDLSGTPN